MDWKTVAIGNPLERFRQTFPKWNILLACTFYSFVTVGSSKVHGLIFVAYYTSTNMSRSAASWPFNLYGLSQIFIAPLTGFLRLRYSPSSIAIAALLVYCLGLCLCFISLDVVYFTICYGLIRSAGVTMAFVIIPSVLTENFKKNTATTVGIDYAGTAIAGLVFPLLSVYLLDKYDLRGFMLLMGSTALHAILGAVMIKVPPSKSGINGDQPVELANVGTDTSKSVYFNNYMHQKIVRSQSLQRTGSSGGRTVKSEVTDGPKSQKSKTSFLKVFKLVMLTPGFHFLTITGIASSFFSANFSVFIIDHMMDRGIELSRGMFVLSTAAIGQVLGHVGLGWITDKGFVTYQTYTGISYLVTGFMAVLVPEIYSYKMFLILGFFIGFSSGTRKSVGTAMFKEYVSNENIALTIGFSRSLRGLTMLSRASLVSFFRDRHGTYDNIFHLNAVLLFFVAFMWFVERIVKNAKGKCYNQNESTESENY